MRTSTLAALAALAALPAASAGAQSYPVTVKERAMMVTDLEASRDRFLAATKGLSEAQWRFKAAPERWSIAQVAEHLAASEELIGGLVRTSLQPGTALSADSAAAVEKLIRMVMADRTQRFQAPEPVAPTGKWPTPSATMGAFTDGRSATLEHIRTTQEPLRSQMGPHPAFGPLDGVSWVVLLATHMDRHVKQIEEVKQAPGYPKM